MATTKAEAIAELDRLPNRSHQQALVEKIEGPKRIKPQRYVIPGGQTMSDDLNAAQLARACSTWLRHCRNFTRVTLSLAKDMTGYNLSRTKVLELNDNQPHPEWEYQGKDWLGRHIAGFLIEDGVVAIEVAKDGIYSLTASGSDFGPGAEGWEPYIEFIPAQLGDR